MVREEGRVKNEEGRVKSEEGRVKNSIAILKRKNQKSKTQHCAIGATIQNSTFNIQNSYSLGYSLPSIRGGVSREAARGWGFKKTIIKQ